MRGHEAPHRPGSTSGSRLASFRVTVSATLLGVLLIIATLLRYTSYSNRRFFGRWSEAHFALITVFAGIFLGIVLHVSRRRHSAVTRSVFSSAIRLSAAIGLFVWGVGLILDSLRDAATGGRLAELLFFSGTTPASMVLEWVSQACFFVAGILSVEEAIRRRLRRESRGYRLAQNALLSLISFGAMYLLLEGGIRAHSILDPETQGFPTKAEALWTGRFVHLNSLGYRDVEHPIQPAKGTSRILLVGDSLAYGIGIKDRRQRLGDLLQQALDGAKDGRFEVINAGRPDSDTVDEIGILARMLAYRPAYVLLLYVFNDIEHVTRPPRSVATDAQSIAARLHPLRLTVRNSQLAEQVFIRIRRALYAYVWKPPGSSDDPYLNDAILEEHLRALDRFFNMCRDSAAQARLIPFDTTVQFTPLSATRYERFVQRVAARGIGVWSLADAFRGHAYPELTVNSLDGHPNELANKLAAGVIVDRFRAEFGSLPPPRN